MDGIHAEIAVRSPSFLRFNLGLVKAFEAEVNFSCMRHHPNDLCIFHDSGSGPGGRWFKSIRPDHSFQEVRFESRHVNFPYCSGFCRDPETDSAYLKTTSAL